MRTLRPDGWPRPSGYSHGVEARGRVVFVAGCVGWDAHETFASDDFVDQVRQALENVVAILREAQAGPEHITRMTWYVVDLDDYTERRRDVGATYRDVIGDHYPAMTLVQVAGLLEVGARVEIEVTAVVPDDPG